MLCGTTQALARYESDCYQDSILNDRVEQIYINEYQDVVTLGAQLAQAYHIFMLNDTDASGKTDDAVWDALNHQFNNAVKDAGCLLNLELDMFIPARKTPIGNEIISYTTVAEETQSTVKWIRDRLFDMEVEHAG